MPNLPLLISAIVCVVHTSIPLEIFSNLVSRAIECVISKYLVSYLAESLASPKQKVEGGAVSPLLTGRQLTSAYKTSNLTITNYSTTDKRIFSRQLGVWLLSYAPKAHSRICKSMQLSGLTSMQKWSLPAEMPINSKQLALSLVTRHSVLAFRCRSSLEYNFLTACLSLSMLSFSFVTFQSAATCSD